MRVSDLGRPTVGQPAAPSGAIQLIVQVKLVLCVQLERRPRCEVARPMSTVEMKRRVACESHWYGEVG